MVLCQCVCVAVIFASLVSAEGVAPAGYLVAGGKRYEPRDGEQPFSFRAGQSVQFVCHMTSGFAVHLYHLSKESRRKAQDSPVTADPARLTLQLAAADNGTLVLCSVETISSPSAKVEVRLRMLLATSAVRPAAVAAPSAASTWVWVFSSVGALVLVALVLWLWVSLRGRRRRRNAANTVTYADRHSIENLDPRATHASESADAGVQRPRGDPDRPTVSPA